MKSNKLLKMGVLVLSLGALAACGETEEPGNGGGDATHTCVADTAAGYQSNGTKHWYKCTDATCKKHVNEAAHTLGAESQTKAPTCTEAGAKKQVCSVCNYEKTGTVAALGHVYEQEEDADKVVWDSRANCETAGAGKKTCTRCSEVTDVTEDALGHEYAKDDNGEDVVTWTKEVSCEEDGAGTKPCTRTGCDHIENVTATKLGHKMELLGDVVTPDDGTATVRTYNCTNPGCSKTELGFKADEVTAASKERLVVAEDGGTRFWGRPIGNAVPLNADGDPSQDNHPSIFDKKETGDFFEYKFTLTAEQAAKLSTAKLYCDAKPASYLAGKDFWANKSGDEDWTRGRFIDDNPDHIQEEEGTRIKYDEAGNKVVNEESGEVETETGVVGKEITDYRYILYVDGGVGHENELNPVDFDGTAVPVQGSAGRETRMEYVLPYTFHLHEGVNTISLRMAGGYRSQFYNFIFRAAEETPADPGDTPAAHTHSFVAGDKAATSALRDASCSCGEAKAYELQAADLTSGQNAPNTSDKGTRLGKTKYDDVWDITGIEAGTYELYINAQASTGNATNGYWNSATAVANGDTATNNGATAELQADYKYKVKVDNGDYINMGASEDNYAAAGLSDSAANWTTKSLATITVGADATTLTIHNMNNGYSIWVFAARLVKVA